MSNFSMDSINQIRKSLEEIYINDEKGNAIATKYGFNDMQLKLIEELNYHCLQLIDAGLLNAKSINVMGQISPQLWRIFDLTYPGHQFLADVRSDTTWNKTKNIAKNVGSESLHALKDIAVGVVTATIQNQFFPH